MRELAAGVDAKNARAGVDAKEIGEAWAESREATAGARLRVLAPRVDVERVVEVVERVVEVERREKIEVNSTESKDSSERSISEGESGLWG